MKRRNDIITGFIVGLALAIAPSCVAEKKCSAATCSTGCCDARGDCQGGSASSACGRLGGICTACPLGQVCNLGSCSGGSSGGGGGHTGGGNAGGGNTGGGNAGGGNTGGGNTGGGNAGGGNAGGGNTGGGGTPCDGCFFNNTCIIKANSNNNTFCGQGGVSCATCTGSQSCQSYVCTGGTGGGGPVGGGTGGGRHCDGCVLPNLTCSPRQISSNSVVNCGVGGVLCVACDPGEQCLSGVCTQLATPKSIGSSCSTDAECQTDLGATAICKRWTSSGNGTYSGGYCTRPCGTGPTVCPSGASCVSLDARYGEADTICWDQCGPTDSCRMGYACYQLATENACWISPLPAVDAGPVSTRTGESCSVDQDCRVPPGSNATCIQSTLPDGGPSGYAGGYCSRLDCSSHSDCSSDGGAACFYVGEDLTMCIRMCSQPRTLTCRSGYACDGFLLADGGASLMGGCFPACNAPGVGPCPAGKTCNTSTGTCL